MKKVLSRLFVAFSIMSVSIFFASCATTGGGSDAVLLVIATVTGGITGPGSQTDVEIQMDGSPVDDASVTVNGTTIPSSGSGTYSFTGTLGLTAGNNVLLNVIKDDMTVSATLAMPYQPIVDPPTSGGIYAFNAPIDVGWSYTTNPDSVIISVDSSFTDSSTEYEETLAGTETSTIIPAFTFKSEDQDNVKIKVTASNTTITLGDDAASGSTFTLNHRGESDSFNIRL